MAAYEIPRLQVLHIISGDSCRTAYDRTDQNGGSCRRGGLHRVDGKIDLRSENPEQQQRYAQDRSDRHSGDGIIRRSHKAGHIPGYGRKKEPGQQGENQGEGKRPPVQPCRDAERFLVYNEQETDENWHGHGEGAPQDDVNGRVPVGPHYFRTMSRSGLPDGVQRRQNAVLDGLDKRDQRPDAPNGHGADAEVPNALAPHRKRRLVSRGSLRNRRQFLREAIAV